MFKRTKISSGVLLALGGALLAPATSVLAQDAGGAQRIEVTGSRILSPNATSPSPLQVLTAEDIASSGVVNIQDLLVKNPTISNNPTFGRNNSNFDTSNSGVATIDLRNLGESRTLVLVNGRRFVAGVPGSSAVDLNAIPTDFIDRIELLTGGASSLYGSDAVAGVVNIILKKNYQGLTADVSGGLSQKGDDLKRKLALTWGANIPEGKGNVMAHLGYSRQGAVYSKDRDGNAIDNITDAALSGNASDIFSFTTPFYSSFAPQGRFFLNPGKSPNPSRTFDANGNIIPFSANGPAGDGVGATGFNRQDFRTIAVPTDRWLLATKAEFELAPNHQAFFEGTYANTSSQSRLEPFPLSGAGTNSVYPVTGKTPADFLVNGALVKNPIVPAGIYSLLTPDPVTGIRYYDWTRRLSEVGSRGSKAGVDNFRAVTGIKGTIANSWDYEVYASYGETKRSQSSTGQVNLVSFRNALEAIPDGKGGAICRDADARKQGCVPINIFGYNTITPAALAYVTAPQSLATKVTQEDYGASISGEPFKLAAGPVGFAAGYEYRKEYSNSEFDALSQAGLNGGNAIPQTQGSFDVKEAYAELRLPILKDAALAKSLSLTTAVRSGDYSSVGSAVSWNAGFEWALNSAFKVRATRALSTRAPNIGELYSPPLQNFPQVSDPCVGVTATSQGARDAACRADPGVAANIAANGSFTLTQADLQGTSGFDRGNPNLKSEEGHSTTVGLIFTPQGTPVSFTADYFDVKINKAIVSTPRQFLLNQCYGGDASFCQFVTRNPTAVGANSAGFLQRVDTASTNSGGVGTAGLDLTAAWADRLGPGRLNTRLAYTHLFSGYLIPLPGADKDNFAGEVGSARDRASLALGYTSGPWAINTQISYIAASSIDDQILSGLCGDNLDPCTPAAPNSVKFPSKTYTDLQVSFTAGKVQYYFGLDNVFDIKPPRIDTNNVLGIGGISNTGVGTVGTTYDPIGRRFYLGLRVSL